MGFEIRLAELNDLDFLVEADIVTDMEDANKPSLYTDEEAASHREKIKAFITDAQKAA